MENLAPEIVRQRLLIEGLYRIDVDEATIRDFFKKLVEELGLRTYAEPTIFVPNNLGRKENSGFDAFVPLIDSGTSLYVWTGTTKFVSCIIYTCKKFDEQKAIEVTKNFFKITKAVHQSF